MTLNENHARAKEVVDSWPSWKREVSLTKRASQLSSSSANTDDNKKQDIEKTKNEVACA